MKKIVNHIEKVVKHVGSKVIKLTNKYRNIIMIALGIIVIIASLFTIGVAKTFGLVAIITGVIVILKFGGKLPMIKFKKKVQTKEVKPKGKKGTKKLLNILGLVILGFGILCLLLGTAFFLFVASSAPKFNPKNLYRKEASVIYDGSGNVLTKIGKEIRDKITYDDMPQVFIDAIIATEDSRFLQHNGFDLPRFLKASFGQALGQNAGGASTITMQVSKNNFTSTKMSVVRKFTDIYVAVFELEKHYTKEEILEFYVNAPYLGNNSYGISEAALNYFGKDLKDINLSEAALLAGLFQAPGSTDPTLYPDRAAARRRTVLSLMKRHGYINAEEEKVANDIPIASLLKKANSMGNNQYQGYIDTVIDEAAKKTGHSPYDVPMKIYTTFDKTKQDYINDILSGKIFDFDNDSVQAGIAVTNINTGAVLAIGNGRNRTGERLFNFATMLKRQIGSTAKPIFDYGPGIEFNNWSTGQYFVDDAYTYSNNKSIKDVDGKYMGIMTMREALSRSRNIPALKAFQQVDNKKIVAFAESLGITPELSNGVAHEAHSIGGFNGSNPLQMAAAYASFGNGGYYIAPYTITKVDYIDSGEEVVYTPTKTRVMSDSTAYMIIDILRFGVSTGRIGAGKVSGVEVAAKSGTTNFDDATKEKYHLPSSSMNDLWYAGCSPDYAVGMWYGYEKITSEHYNTTANWSDRDRLFNTIAKGIFDKNGKTFVQPKSVVEVSVERDSIPAMLPSKYTPDDMRMTELFKVGTEPTDVSPRFAQLTNPTGLNITSNAPNVNLTWTAVSAPITITDEYLETIKDQQDKYLGIRASYDASVLGTIGYNIYLKDSGGALTWLGYTNNNSYTYKPSSSGTLTFVVKTAYSIFKRNESSGAQITLSDNPYASIKTASLKGSNTMNIKVGGIYTELGATVSINGIPVDSNDTKVHYTRVIKKDGVVIQGTTIDTSVVGTKYEITYSVTYDGVEVDFDSPIYAVRTITITAQ